MNDMVPAAVRQQLRIHFRVLAASAACLAAPHFTHADAPPALTSIRETGTNFEGRRTYALEWDAASNALYRIQARRTFESNTVWETFDLVQAARERAALSVAADEAVEPEQFFRVLAPQPEIFNVQPALVSANGDVIYLAGQCFPSNALVYIGGVLQTNSTWLGAGLLRIAVALDPSPEETSLNVRVESPTAGLLIDLPNAVTLVAAAAARQRLLEVSTEPPASPIAMKAKEKGNRTKCGNNLRVMPATGELQVQATDLVVPGRGLDFVWTRTYRSRTGRNTVMGQGWSHGYDLFCFQTNNGIAVSDGTGRIDVYSRGTTGVYTRDESFNSGTLSNGVFTLEFPETGTWVFKPLTQGGAPAPIHTIKDRLGNALTFNHDPNNWLTEIIDTLGRTNRVVYDGLGRVASVVDFTGRAVRYTYWRAGEAGGGNGALRSVTTPEVTGTPHTNDFPRGKTTTFTYTTGSSDPQLNHNLLTITDPDGQTWFSAEYGTTTNATNVEFDRLTSIRRGDSNAPRAFLSYSPLSPAASNRFAVIKTIVNDSVGNVSIGWFDSMNRGIVHRDLAARAQPDTSVTETNLPTMKLRDSDPDYWETTYEWNFDSLCTRVTFPRGNSTDFIYQRAFNQNSSRSNHARRSDGDPLVIRELACCGGADMDGDGNLDGAELVWRLAFDPRFGSPATLCSAGRGWMFASGPRQSTSLDGSRCGGDNTPIIKGSAAWDGTVSSGLFRKKNKGGESYQPWDMDDDCDSLVRNPLYEQSGSSGENPLFESARFVVRATDARGNSDTASYDAKGSPIVISHTGRLLDGSDKPLTEFEYNAHGQLAAVTYPDNGGKFRRRDEFSYSPQTGLLSEWTVDATGPTVSATRYEHDARGNLTAIVNARGHTDRFVYNALDQIVRSEAPAICNPCSPVLTDYFYDANDNVIRIERSDVDGAGILETNNPTWTTLFEYDALNRCTTVAHELTHTVQQRFATNRFVYDANDDLIAALSPEAVNSHQPGNGTAYEFDTRRLPWRQVRGPGTPEQSTDEFDYDGNGNLARASYGSGGGAGGSVYERAYDGFDRCASITDPMGNVSRFAYDNNHNLIYERRDGETNDVPGSAGNQRLAETRYEYDSLDRRLRTRVAFFDVLTGLPLLDGEATTKFTHAASGACRSVTDDNGHTTSYSYDSRGRLASATDPKGNVVSYTYDANDNVVSTLQSDSSDLSPARVTFVKSSHYDAWDRCVLEFDNVGNTNRYAYDSRNNVTHHIDPRGSLRRWQHDGLNRAIAIETDMDGDGEFEPLDIVTQQIWDDNSRLVQVIDDNTNSTHYHYDALNRLALVVHADNSEVQFTYDARGNVKTNIDANGSVVLHSYDALNRRVRKDIAPASALGVSAQTTFETYAYDGQSRPVLASNNVSMIEFSYDSMGNRSRQKQDCVAAAFVHDGEGNRTSMTYPGGRIVNVSLDSLNRPTTLASTPRTGVPATTLMTFSHEGARRLARMTRNNGIHTRLYFNGDTKNTNAPGDFGWQRITRLNHQHSGGGTTIDRRYYAYDRAQNKTSRAQGVAFAQGAPLKTNQWSYDAVHRMTASVSRTGGSSSTRSYRLDGNGNRQQVIHDGAVMNYLMDATMPEPADFQMDQYWATPFDSRQYDRNGNLVYIPGPAGGTLFTYDYANRLVSVAREIGPALSPMVTFTYDCFGRRLSKTTYPPAPAAPDTTVFYYDGERIIEERDGAGSTRKTVVFPHALEVSGRILFTAGGETQHLIADELGNALVLTDAGGNVIERYEYDDYGAPAFLSADGSPLIGSDGQPVTSSPAGNAYLFRGMYWDAETGLYFGHSQGATTGPLKWMAPEALNGRRWDNNPYSEDAQRYANNPYSEDAQRWNQDPYAEDVMRCFDPKAGRFISRGGAVRSGANAFSFAGENPWTVIGLDSNPKEHTISRSRGVQEPLVQSYRWRARTKEDVYVWKIRSRAKEDVYVWKLKKEEGGRHTPFHNKLAAHELTHVVQQESRGQCDVGGYRTRHDTVKNCIGNIRARVKGGGSGGGSNTGESAFCGHTSHL